MFPQALGLDYHAHIVALDERVDGLHRSCEISNIEAPAQIVGQLAFLEIDHQGLPLLSDINPGIAIGQLDDHPAGTVGAAPEVDIAQRGSPVGHPGLRERRGGRWTRTAGAGSRRDGDEHGFAVNLGIVCYGALEVQYHTGTIAHLNHVDAAQFTLADILTVAAERIDRVWKIERDSRRIRDQESGRRIAGLVLQVDLENHRSSLLRDIHGFDRVLCLYGQSRQGQAYGSDEPPAK